MFAGQMAAAGPPVRRAGCRWSRGSPSCCPEVLLGLGPAEFAAIAARTLAPSAPVPVVSTEHLHMPADHVREQAAILAGRLAQLRPGHVPAAHRRLRRAPTRSSRGSWPCSSCTGTAASALDQVAPLGELYVTWTRAISPTAEPAPQQADE